MAKASLNTAELIGTDDYGSVPRKIYTRFRKLNVSPSDFDELSEGFRHDWDGMLEFVETLTQWPGTTARRGRSHSGSTRPHRLQIPRGESAPGGFVMSETVSRR